MTVIQQEGRAEALRHDRAATQRLGQLLVLAVGVALVVIVAGTMFELVSALFDDVLAAPGGAPPAS